MAGRSFMLYHSHTSSPSYLVSSPYRRQCARGESPLSGHSAAECAKEARS